MKKKLKKIVFITLFLSINFSVFAPENPKTTIIRPRPVEPFRKLIHAIGKVETGFDTLAYNPEEEASGYFQIRPIRLLDYNIRTGSSYSMKDLFNYYISEKIFLYYASQYGPYDFERIARSWNGSGDATKEYWKKVSQHL